MLHIRFDKNHLLALPEELEKILELPQRTFRINARGEGLRTKLH
jgi:hypothetical protein